MRYGLCTTAGITITPPPPSLEILISGSNFFSTPFDCVCVCSRLFLGGNMPIPLGTRVAVKSVDVGTLPEHDELRGVALVCFFFFQLHVCLLDVFGQEHCA